MNIKKCAHTAILLNFISLFFQPTKITFSKKITLKYRKVRRINAWKKFQNSVVINILLDFVLITFDIQ